MTNNTQAPTTISNIGVAMFTIADQDAAIAFYTQTLGWELRADVPFGDEGGNRWVEVAPPGSPVRLALVPPTEGASPGGDVVRCALTSTAIDADHAALVALGVDVDPVVAREGTSRPGLVATAVTVPDPFPPQVCFRDPDGNRFLIVGPPPG
jgi:catechol 2,3-dioxygenase-like lactoylglutathione lyase family enzyme